MWTLIVLGFIALNVVRGFLDSGGFDGTGGSDDVSATEPPTQRSGAAFTLDPGLQPGLVEFGTSTSSAGGSCDLNGRGTTFPESARVWWIAHLGVLLPGNERVVWAVTRDGQPIIKDSAVNGIPTDTYSGLCGTLPIPNEGAGTYVLTVWEPTSNIVLSIGQYQVVAGSPIPNGTP